MSFWKLLFIFWIMRTKKDTSELLLAYPPKDGVMGLLWCDVVLSYLTR